MGRGREFIRSDTPYRGVEGVARQQAPHQLCVFLFFPCMARPLCGSIADKMMIFFLEPLQQK